MHREGSRANKASFVTAVRVIMSRWLPFGKLFGGKLPELMTFVTSSYYLDSPNMFNKKGKKFGSSRDDTQDPYGGCFGLCA